MNVVLKIDQLAAAPDSVMIAIGTGSDLQPWEFLQCGESTWIAPCPCCASGVIETDSPDYAAAKCDACFDAEPMPEAVESPPVLEVRFPIPAPRPPSLVNSVAGKVPVPKYQDKRPVYTPKPTPQCKICQKYLAPSPDGAIRALCGECAEAKASKPKVARLCRDCGTDMSHTYESKQFCNDCSRARAVTGQRRMTKTSKTTKERRAAKEKDRPCEKCGVMIFGAHHVTKYCSTCKVEMQNHNRRQGMARLREREKIQQQEGEAA